MAEINEGRGAGGSAGEGRGQQKPRALTRRRTWDRSTTCWRLRRQARRRHRLRVGHRRARSSRQLTELGARGRRSRRAAARVRRSTSSTEVDLSDPASIDTAVAAIGGPVDALFNVAGVSSGIGDPLRVVTINFLGTRHFTEALIPSMPAGSAIASVSSLAASEYRGERRGDRGPAGHRDDGRGRRMVRAQPEALADGGGYRLSKEAIILYGMANVAALGAKGIRINCTAPGVTDTPILDQLRSAYGQEFLDSFRTPLGRVAGPGRAGRACWSSSTATRRATSPDR